MTRVFSNTLENAGIETAAIRCCSVDGPSKIRQMPPHSHSYIDFTIQGFVEQFPCRVLIPRAVSHTLSDPCMLSFKTELCSIKSKQVCKYEKDTKKNRRCFRF